MNNLALLFRIIFISTSVLLSFPFTGWTQSAIVLGDIGDDPRSKIQKVQPLVNYVAERLKSEGITTGQVVVTENIYQMAELFKQGRVDIFVDSPFPAVAVSRLAGTRFLLRRWKKGIGEYHTVIFVRKDSGIDRLDELQGNLISFEDPHSSSGYFLPKVLLQQQGFKLSLKSSPSQQTAPNEIGYVFSDGDETTMVWVLREKVEPGPSTTRISLKMHRTG